jgi:hypothetical protein
VLLVDDVVDSGWTLTLLAAVLRQRGSGPVFPFALPATAREIGLSALKLGEWNELERKLRASPLKTPAALQGRGADELARTLTLPPEDASAWRGWTTSTRRICATR